MYQTNNKKKKKCIKISLEIGNFVIETRHDIEVKVAEGLDIAKRM